MIEFLMLLAFIFALFLSIGTVFCKIGVRIVAGFSIQTRVALQVVLTSLCIFFVLHFFISFLASGLIEQFGRNFVGSLFRLFMDFVLGFIVKSVVYGIMICDDMSNRIGFIKGLAVALIEWTITFVLITTISFTVFLLFGAVIQAAFSGA